MWNSVTMVYLIAFACIQSLFSLPLAGHEGMRLVAVFTASLTYPLFLVRMRPKTGFWKGALSLLIIFAVALLCGFVAYLLCYTYFEYKRLGSEFHLLESLGWTFSESLAVFLLLDVWPATIIAGVCYPVGYLASFQVFRLIRNRHPRS